MNPEQKPVGILIFIRAVLLELWTYFAYGLGAAIPSIWSLATDRALPRVWIYLALIPLGFLSGGFLVWRKERIERNAMAAEVAKLNAEVDRLDRPCFVSEVDVAIEEDLQRPDWIKIYMNLVIRNQGAESTIDRWRIVVLPPSGTPHLEDRRSLNAVQRGPHNLMNGNLLNDREIIQRGGTKEGWLLYEGPQARLGVSKEQTPVVEVSFKDVHEHEYHVVSRPGFERQMEDIRMGRFGLR